MKDGDFGTGRPPPRGPTWLIWRNEVALIDVHAQPGARRDALVGEFNGRLKIAVRAAASEGQANRAIAELLARQLGVARSAVTLLQGATQRDKRFAIQWPGGTSPQELTQRLVPEKKTGP